MQGLLVCETLPSLLLSLIDEIDSLEKELDSLKNQNASSPVWLNVKELSKYLPNHPSIPTIYRWCSEGTIPFHKVGGTGKNNIFNKSEIDAWYIAHAN